LWPALQFEPRLLAFEIEPGEVFGVLVESHYVGL
jgi:hypothetical protein